MADKEVIVKERLEHDGLFDFREVYKFAWDWLREENYGTTEKKYSEKVTGNEKEIKIEWESIKTVSDYFRIQVELKYEILRMTEVEVEIDGTKKKMNKGKIKIDFKGILITDPNNVWNTTPFYRFLRDTYNKYVIPARIDSLRDKIFGDVKDLNEQLKALVESAGRR